MVIEDDHEGLYEFDHQNFESVNLQVNDGPRYHQNIGSMNLKINDVPCYDNEDLNIGLPLKSRSISSDSDDSSSKRSRTSPESNSEEGELLGLTLNKTPSFVNLLETQLLESKSCSSRPPRQRVGRPSSRKNDSGNKSKMEDFAIASEKLKASNFPAIQLRIGEWERVSKHEGDLIAKCYYAKRKIVWEILDGPLKNKIEIQWSDIIAIRAIMPQGQQPGVLEIELNQAPMFYRETNPQPRKHTMWQQTVDFTGGQAPIHRRHYVSFPPGVLDKHYEKLLCYDARLKELSKQPFPSNLCPYFEVDNTEVSDFSFANDYGPQFFPRMHHPFNLSASSPALIPNHRMHNRSAVMAVPLRHFSSSFPLSGGQRSDYAHINQRGVPFGPGSSNLMDVAMGNQTTGMLSSSTTPQANWIVPTQDHQSIYQQNDSMSNNQENAMLNYIKSHFMEDNQVSFPNEIPNVDSTCSLLEHHDNRSLIATGDVHGLNSHYQTMNNYTGIILPNNGMTYAEPVTCFFPQETSQILAMGQFMGHSTNSYPTLDANRDV
ncbi:unnamed protein product [Withania somnifera]